MSTTNVVPPVVATPPATGGSVAPASALGDAIARRTGGPRWRELVGVAVGWAILVAVLAVVVQRGKLADSVVYIAIFGIAAIGYDAIVGIAGQLYLGLNGLIAIGAYGAGLLAIHATSSPVAGLAVGAAGGAVAAVLTGVIALRLREFYFAIFTLAFGIFVEFTLMAWQDVTGGSTGLGPVPGCWAGRSWSPTTRPGSCSPAPSLAWP